MVRRAKSDGARRVFLVPYNPKAPIYVALREHVETAHRPQGRFLLPMEAPGMRGSEILRARQVKMVNLEAVFARAAYKRPSATLVGNCQLGSITTGSPASPLFL